MPVCWVKPCAKANVWRIVWNEEWKIKGDFLYSRSCKKRNVKNHLEFEFLAAKTEKSYHSKVWQRSQTYPLIDGERHRRQDRNKRSSLMIMIFYDSIIFKCWTSPKIKRKRTIFQCRELFSGSTIFWTYPFVNLVELDENLGIGIRCCILSNIFPDPPWQHSNAQS